MAPKILIVLTSHAEVKNGPKTGWFLPELAHPYNVFGQVADVVVASPLGGEAPLSVQSIEMSPDEESQKFLREKQDVWSNTEVLSTFGGRAQEFDAIFYVGGGGPMFDLACDDTSQQIIREFYEAGKVVSTVCHGSVAISRVRLSTGEYLVAGQKVTGFSNEEEHQSGLWDVVPIRLEDELRKNVGEGGAYEAAPAWTPKVLISGPRRRLLTGQNPASARALANAVIEAVAEKL
ncbi:hypothetical protein LTR78_001266 [Recurvomyces mirabilis]|uniref:D-lactate dehydratase n=1 Tax=Recurvomyces mirabilis TaxID=574656 RepID=A0AAE0WVP8_9PEZI|nr:hypothetical protein LTR78_001266 [Recurvomyces mirabilis]KAK5161242.1 hypothetical protein LTS14_001038 [Recurvomyces mirabilis]